MDELRRVFFSKLINICLVGAFGVFLWNAAMAEMASPRTMTGEHDEQEVTEQNSNPAVTLPNVENASSSATITIPTTTIITADSATTEKPTVETPTVQTTASPTPSNPQTLLPEIISETQHEASHAVSLQTTPEIPTPTLTEKPLTISPIDNPVPSTVAKNRAVTLHTISLPVLNLVSTEILPTTSENNIALKLRDNQYFGGQFAFTRGIGRLVFRSFTGEIIHVGQ